MLAYERLKSTLIDIACHVGILSFLSSVCKRTYLHFLRYYQFERPLVSLTNKGWLFVLNWTNISSKLRVRSIDLIVSIIKYV